MADQPTVLLRRDKAGHAASWPQMLVVSLAAGIFGFIATALIDGLFALIGLGSFGTASGWFALIPAALIFFDDLRSWHGYGARFLVAIVAALAAIGLGLILASVLSDLRPLLSGGVGALFAILVYSPIWFYGVRFVTGNLR